MNTPPPKFFWGRENKQYQEWMTDRYDNRNKISELSLDYQKEIPDSDKGEDYPEELTIPSLSSEEGRNDATEYLDRWMGSFSQRPDYFLKEFPGGNPEDLNTYSSQTVEDDPLSFAFGHRLDENASATIVSKKDNPSLIVSYQQKDGENVQCSLCPLTEEEAAVVHEERNRRSDARREKMKQREQENKERFAKLIEENGGNKRFLLSTQGGQYNQLDRGMERIYRFDTHLVEKLGLDDSDIGDYVRGTLGDYLHGGTYDSRRGIYTGYKD